MPSLSRRRHSRHFRLHLPAKTFLHIVFPGLLLGLVCSFCAGQNTKGLAVVGTGGSTTNSQMLIDATQFFQVGSDMCNAIALACAKLGAPNYPLGATIDARGFTGNQVCAAANATQMLKGCAAFGGKLLLGTVNLYADGPTAHTYYEDSFGSGIGTPAFLIPSGFWGIEGTSRGSTTGSVSTSGPGTFLSVCTGTNTPVNGCTTGFPVRSLLVASTSVSGNTMTITPTASLSWGVNIYAGELVMMKGNTGAPNQNGTYKIQNSSGSTVQVTVPTGTTGSCSSGCGTLFLGTPILGFEVANPSIGTNFYNSTSCNSSCAAFGMHIKNFGFNCQDQDGCIGWQNLYAQEESGADTFIVNYLNFVGVDIHTTFSQNFGPVLNAEIYTGAANTACDYGTTGVYIGDSSMRGFNGWTINESNGLCGHQPIAAVLLDAPAADVRNGHCEGFANCVLMGANIGQFGGASGQRISNIAGQPSAIPGQWVVQVSPNYPANSDYVVSNLRSQSGGDSLGTFSDGINGITVTDNYLGVYSASKNNGLTNILTSDTANRNRFDGGVRAASLATGVTTGAPVNTDLAGSCTIGNNCGGGTNTYTFQGTYTHAPICTCMDNSFLHLCKATASNVAISFSGTSTDTINYICMVTN